MFKFLKTLKNKKFLVKLIAATALIAALSIIITSIAAYYNAKNIITEKTLSEVNSSLSHTINALEVVVDYISIQCNQLIMNERLRDFESFPNGKYFENLKPKYPEEDLDSLYSYIEYKSDLRILLTNAVVNSDIIHSMYFYDSSKDVVISTMGIGTSFEKFEDTQWEEAVGSTEFPVFMDVRRDPISSSDENEHKEILTVIYRSVSNNNNFLIVNLDKQYVYDNYINVNRESGDGFLLVSGTGSVLMEDTSVYGDENTDALLSLFESVKGYEMKEIDGTRVLVVIQDSAQLGWRFMLIKKLDNLYYDFYNFGKLLLIIAGGVLVIMIGVVVFMDIRIYRPVKALSDKIHRGRQEQNGFVGEPALGKGEFDLIDSHISKYAEENMELSKRLEYSATASKERFFDKLVSRKFINSTEIKKQLSYMALDITLSKFMVALITIDDNSEDHTSGEDRFGKVVIASYLSNIIKKEYSAEVVEIGDDEILILLNCSLDVLKSAQKFIETSIDGLSHAVNAAVSLAIGGYCNDLDDLPEQYRRAMLILRYQRITGSNEIFYTPVVERHTSGIEVYPREMREMLLSAIDTGSFAEARKILSIIKRQLFNNISHMNYLQIKHQILGIVVPIIDYVQETLGDFREITGSHANFYEELLLENEYEKIWELILDIIGHLEAKSSDGLQKQETGYVDKVIMMLQADCGKDITLNTIADSLRLSSVYLSKIFKQKTGINFTKYITQLRMEKAKYFLTNTDMKIKDIAFELGYSNSQYFIKIFKSYVAITPGEYMRLNRRGMS